jgi:hypothetical protein
MGTKILKIIGVILGILILILAISYVIDAFTVPVLKKRGASALQELVSLRTDDEANAWNYYARAIETMSTREFNGDIDKYIRGEIDFNPQIEEYLRINNDLIDLIDKGTQQSFCSIPLEYEEGATFKIPNLVALQRCSKIHAAGALHAFENGAADDGITRIKQGLTCAQHTISGSPTLIMYMVGTVITGINLKVLESALSTGRVNKPQAQEISLLLGKFENELPSLIWALEGEHKQSQISLAKMPFYGFITDVNTLTSYLVNEVGIRFLLWRYIFSLKLATLKSIEMFDKLLLEMKTSAQEFTGAAEYDIAIVSQLDKKKIENFRRENLIFAYLIPNYARMFERKSKVLAKARLLNTSALIWQFKFEKGIFPKSLAEIESKFVKDPYRDRPWDYIYTEDSVVVKSPGTNLKYGDEDDLSITLKK